MGPRYVVVAVGKRLKDSSWRTRVKHERRIVLILCPFSLTSTTERKFAYKNVTEKNLNYNVRFLVMD